MASLAEKVYMDLMARGKDVETARYIGKYLHTQSYHVRKYIMSAGWVFPGWISWSKRFRRKNGVYPDEMYPGILIKLARMSKSERDEIMNKLMEI
jgi:hypothetical protein